MRALVLEGPGTMALKEIPVWPIGRYGDDDLVLVRVEACGICGSDYRYFEGENPWALHTLGQPLGNAPNIVLGHEFGGTVTAVLHPRNQHLLGKKVAAVCSKVCGQCDDCLSGREHLCPNTVHLGHGQGWGDQEYFPGAYAQYAPAWGSACRAVPSKTDDRALAMLDILAVGIHVVGRARLRRGQRALVLGCGPAGNAILQVLTLIGVTAFAADRSPLARSLAKAEAVAPSWEDLPPGPYDAVFDSIGTHTSLEQGLRRLQKGGTFVNMAVHDGPVDFDGLALSGERTITTSCNFLPEDWRRALAWLRQRRWDLDGWFHDVPIAEVPGWFARAPEHRPGFKAIVRPWA